MENRGFNHQDENVIDLGEMMRFIGRKWKWLLACCLLGALIGAGFGFMKANESQEPVLYTEGERLYYISARKQDMLWIQEMYKLLANEIAQEARELSGAASVALSEYPQSSGSTESTVNPLLFAKASLKVSGADRAAYDRLMSAADTRVQQLHQEITLECDTSLIRLIGDVVNETKQAELAMDKSPSMLLAAVVFSIFLMGMGAALLVLLFIFDGHVKTAKEIRDRYGLYTIAQYPAGKKNADGETDEYVLSFFKLAGMDKIQLCADESNPVIAKKAALLAGRCDALEVSRPLADDQDALVCADETEGTVLFVQLWKTTHAEFERELEILGRMEQRVVGVIVLE